VHGACYAGCVPEHPGWPGGSGWVVPASLFPVPVNPAAEVLLPAGLGRCTGLYVAVHRIGATDGLAHIHIAYSAPAVSLMKCRFRRSGTIWRCRQ